MGSVKHVSHWGVDEMFWLHFWGAFIFHLYVKSIKLERKAISLGTNLLGKSSDAPQTYELLKITDLKCRY